VKPIQRICKYPLLLKELLAHSPDSHPDYESLRSAIIELETVTTSVNEGKRQSENQQRVLEVANVVQGIEVRLEHFRTSLH
jgi:hypothetical protein